MLSLQEFLNLTATVPEPTLRRALALALSVERPTSHEDYTRFYGRVVAALCDSCADGKGTTQPLVDAMADAILTCPLWSSSIHERAGRSSSPRQTASP